MRLNIARHKLNAGVQLRHGSQQYELYLVAQIGCFAQRPARWHVHVHIEWDEITEAVPAFLTIVFMPFTYSIADGIAMGFISYALIKLFTGKAKTVPYMVWIIAALWALKFAMFGG